MKKVKKTSKVSPQSILLLFSRALLLLVSCRYPASALSYNDKQYNHLDNWLEKISFNLPAFTVVTPVGPLKVKTTFSEVTCSSFQIECIHSTPTKDGSTEKINFGVGNAAVKQCKGKWSGNNGGIATLNGGFSFGVKGVEFDNTVIFDPFAAGGVISAQSKTCTNSFQLVDIAFTGKLSTLLNLLTGVVKGAVEKIVEHVACELPSKVMAIISKAVEPLLGSPEIPKVQPSAMPVKHKRFVKWASDVPMLKALPDPEKMAAMVNRAVKKNVDIGNIMKRAPKTLKRAFLTKDATLSALIPGMDISFNLRDINLSGLDTFESLSLLQAVKRKPYSLRMLGFQMNSFSVDLDVDLVLKPLNEKWFFNGPPLKLNCQAKVDLNSVTGEVQALVAALYKAANNITLEEILHVSEKDAVEIIAKAFYSVNVTELSAMSQLSKARVIFDRNYGDPQAIEITTALNNFISPFVKGTESSNDKSFSNVAANALLVYVLPKGRNIINNQLNSTLTEYKILAKQLPQNNGSTDPPGKVPDVLSSSAISFTTAVIFSITAIALSVYALCFPKCTHIAPVSFWKMFQEIGECEIAAATDYEELTVVEAQKGVRSLAFLYRNHDRIKLLYPLLHVTNMAWGIWSICTPICNVQLKIQGGIVDPGKLMLDDSLLVYTFWQMVHDFWACGSYLICISLLVGGCILPQFKGIATMYIWLVPLQRSTRGWILFVTDILGRVAFINQFFIAIMVITLRAHVVLPGLVVNVTAQPVFGIVSGTFATTIMMLLSTWTMYLHNNIENVPDSADDIECLNLSNGVEQQSSSLGTDNSTLETGLSREKDKVASERTVYICFGVTFASGILYLYGLSFYALELDMKGLGGDGEDLKGSETPAAKRFGVLSLPGKFYSLTDQTIPAVAIVMVYVVIVLIGPMVVWLCSLAEWYHILQHGYNPRERLLKNGVMKRISYGAPYLYSYAGIEVLAAAFFSSSLEMNNVVNWVVQKQFGNLCGIVLDVLDTPCLHIDGSLGPGFVFLALSALFFGFMFAKDSYYLGVFGLKNLK